MLRIGRTVAFPMLLLFLVYPMGTGASSPAKTSACQLRAVKIRVSLDMTEQTESPTWNIRWQDGPLHLTAEGEYESAQPYLVASFTLKNNRSGTECKVSDLEFSGGLWITSNHDFLVASSIDPETQWLSVYRTDTCQIAKELYFAKVASPGRVIRKPFCHTDCGATCDCYAGEIYILDSHCMPELQATRSEALTRKVLGVTFQGKKEFPIDSAVVKKGHRELSRAINGAK